MLDINYKTLEELLKAFPDEQSCINHLETIRWHGIIVSPFDNNSKVYKCKNNRYRCKNSGNYFNVKTNTIFDSSKIQLQKWFIAIWLITSKQAEISSIQLSTELQITQKSAWLMIQRIKECFDGDNYAKHTFKEQLESNDINQNTPVYA